MFSKAECMHYVFPLSQYLPRHQPLEYEFWNATSVQHQQWPFFWLALAAGSIIVYSGDKPLHFLGDQTKLFYNCVFVYFRISVFLYFCAMVTIPSLPMWSNTIVLNLCICVFFVFVFCISVQWWRALHFLDDQTQSFSPLDAALSRLTVQLWLNKINWFVIEGSKE